MRPHCATWCRTLRDAVQQALRHLSKIEKHRREEVSRHLGPVAGCGASSFLRQVRDLLEAETILRRQMQDARISSQGQAAMHGLQFNKCHSSIFRLKTPLCWAKKQMRSELLEVEAVYDLGQVFGGAAQ